MSTLSDFSAPAIDGTPTDLSAYDGKVVLVVNTASQCGLTGQYKGLQELQRHLRRPGPGRARLPVRPVRQPGARRRGGDLRVLRAQLRRHLPDVRQGRRQRRRRPPALRVAQGRQGRAARQRSSGTSPSSWSAATARSSTATRRRRSPRTSPRTSRRRCDPGQRPRRGGIRRGGDVGSSSGSEWRRDGRFTTSRTRECEGCRHHHRHRHPVLVHIGQGRAAVARGGLIRFSCGPDPVTITLERTAKVVNTSSRVVLDGDGRVTLSGGGVRRILYMNTCDGAQVWTTSHCNDQESPRLVVRQMGSPTATRQVRPRMAGRRRHLRARRPREDRRLQFAREPVGPDGSRPGRRSRASPEPVRRPARRRRRSSFTGGRCSNGSALSSISVSWTSPTRRSPATEPWAAEPTPRAPGRRAAAAGGAIYMDGDDIHPRAGGLDDHRQPRP